MNPNKLNRWTEIATHDKRVVAAEIAATLIWVYRRKLSEDPGMNRNILNFQDRVWQLKDNYTNWWIDFHTAQVTTLQDKLEQVRGTDEYEQLLSLKNKLSQTAGQLADKSTLVTRHFNLGEMNSGEMSGSVKTLMVETDEGIYSVDEITPETATEGLLEPELASGLKVLTDLTRQDD